jgi:hypothetical protein
MSLRSKSYIPNFHHGEKSAFLALVVLPEKVNSQRNFRIRQAAHVFFRAQ